MDAAKKRVAIVGAGPSGLAACKHALAKGFRPVVLEAGGAAGGVWTRTLACTRLQTPWTMYRFSDFPWPADAAVEEFPRHDRVLAYLTAYARRFGVLECVRFGSKVLGAEYAGVPEREVAAWERWSGSGEAFGDGTGEWHLTVHHTESGTTETHKFDFLILCVGRFGVAKIPAFPHKKGGPELFRGHVVHSADYSRMAHEDAAELIRGKRVVVVGAGKSGLDIAAQCAQANGSKHPCTLVYRSAHWLVDLRFPWCAKLGNLMTSRMAEAMVHKPGEGFARSLVATLLNPLVWLTGKLAEKLYKAYIPTPEHGVVPDFSLTQSMRAWRLAVLPEGFNDAVEQGSVVLKKHGSFSFSDDGLGLVLDGTGVGERVDADVVIFATGFDGDRLLKDVFVSYWFRQIVAGPSNTAMLPLYRHCVHPRIPQMAVVGYLDS